MKKPVEYQAIVIVGNGRSLHPVTKDVPEPLLPIANRPMIYYVLSWLETCGIQEIFVVVPTGNAESTLSSSSNNNNNEGGPMIALGSPKLSSNVGVVLSPVQVAASSGNNNNAAPAGSSPVAVTVLPLPSSASAVAASSLSSAGNVTISTTTTQTQSVVSSAPLKLNSFKNYDGKARIDLIYVDDTSNTASVLESMKHRIYASDIIIVNDDLITDAPLHHFTDSHKVNNADITCLLAEEAVSNPKMNTPEDVSGGGGKKSAGKKASLADAAPDFDDDVPLIGLDKSNSRMLYYNPEIDFDDDDVSLRMLLLKKFPHLELRADLRDVQCYIMKSWLLDELIPERRSVLPRIKDDFIPFLVKAQCRPSLLESIKAFGVDPFASPPFSIANESTANFSPIPANSLPVNKDAPLDNQASKAKAERSASSMKQQLSMANQASFIMSSNSASSATGVNGTGSTDNDIGQLLVGTNSANVIASKLKQSKFYASRMYSGLLEGSGVPLDLTQVEGPLFCGVYLLNSGFCMKVNSFASYKKANFQIMRQTNIARNGHFEVHGKSQVGNDSIVGDGTTIGDKTSVKKSSIGQNCHIGNGVKISNCIIMDGVRIDDGCRLENCIICFKATLREKVTLINCEVCQQIVVEKEINAKNETFESQDTFIMAD